MKTLIASVKFLAITLVIATVVGFFVMDQINLRNNWLTIKPVANAAMIANLVEWEKNHNTEVIVTDELNIAEVQNLLPRLEEEKLHDETFYYVEGTYEAYCIVTFNATDKVEEENMIIKSNDNFARIYAGPGGNCSEGIVERAYDNAWYVGPEGGVPIM